jgi:hypothetical protein
MNEENEIEYSVDVRLCVDYCDDYNYRKQYVESDYTLAAESIDALYEYIAKTYVNWRLEAEKRIKGGSDSYRNDIEDYYVEFGPIHIIVEQYDENKMKATTTYADKGKTRDEYLTKQKILEAAKKKAEQERTKKYQEQQEKEQYLRLKRKFEKTS